MANQTEIPGVSERTVLGKAAHDFLEQKHRIEDEQANLEKIAKRVLEAMKEEKRQLFKLNDEGQVYVFKIVEAEEKLSCQKAKEPRR